MSSLNTNPSYPACSNDPLAAFVVASRFHTNAQCCVISRQLIDFGPLEELASACAVVFGSVDRDDAFQRRIARDAWLLKATLMLTLLPFDDERLGLTELIKSLQQAAGSVPEIAAPVNDLSRVVGTLLKEPANPKRERVLDMLRCADSMSDPVALVANLHGSMTPGWPTDIDDKKDLGNCGAVVVRTRKEVRERFFSRIVVPGNPKFVPRKLLFDLLYGGRSSTVIVACYRAERVWVPYPPKLPIDRLFTDLRPTEADEEDAHVVDASISHGIDQWAQDSFWDSIRARHGNIVPTSDRDVSVRARFVLFADGSGAFLPEDGRVVEIADRFDFGQELDEVADRLPRKAVIELDEGDLVMLRLSGSGDYLDDVADTLMNQAGEGYMRDRALEWKDWLNGTLRRHGEGMVARKLREQNGSLRSANYLWSWAGDAVMAPHDFPTFLRLR